jgi:hypothetical protein
VVAKIRERMALSKQTMYRFHVKKFILKKFNEVGGKK